MSKKSNYRVLAEAIAFDQLKKVKLPTSSVDHRRLSVDEIKQHIVEEFKKAIEASDVKVQEPPKGWGDADLEKEIEWIKTLKLEEFFKKGE